MTKVLIVEDDKELREALCTTLQLAGMAFVEADCAETALIELERSKVDIVVSDVNMPGMDNSIWSSKASGRGHAKWRVRLLG